MTTDDDRVGHFHAMLVDAVGGAVLGRFEISLVLRDGSSVRGVPDEPVARFPDEPASDEPLVAVAGDHLALGDVSDFCVHGPG